MLVLFSLRVTSCVFWFMKTFVLAGGYELFCGAYCLHFRNSCTSTLRRWRYFPQKFRYHRCSNPGDNLSIKLTTVYNYVDEFRHFIRLTPNDPYTGRTAPLTSKVAFYIFIQQI
jgi:hypothetical protein